MLFLEHKFLYFYSILNRWKLVGYLKIDGKNFLVICKIYASGKAALPEENAYFVDKCCRTQLNCSALAIPKLQ